MMHWAVKSLRPNSHFEIRDDVLIWTESNEDEAPTKSEIDAEIIRLQAEEDAQEYARNRTSSSGYPSVGDQLDEIYHNGIDSWKAVIKVTKDKYPKS